MKRSRLGDVVLQLKNGPSQCQAAEKLRDAVSDIMDEAEVRYQAIAKTVTIRDLEPEITEEVLKAE